MPPGALSPQHAAMAAAAAADPATAAALAEREATRRRRMARTLALCVVFSTRDVLLLCSARKYTNFIFLSCSFCVFEARGILANYMLMGFVQVMRGKKMPLEYKAPGIQDSKKICPSQSLCSTVINCTPLSSALSLHAIDDTVDGTALLTG